MKAITMTELELFGYAVIELAIVQQMHDVFDFSDENPV